MAYCRHSVSISINIIHNFYFTFIQPIITCKIINIHTSNNKKLLNIFKYWLSIAILLELMRQLHTILEFKSAGAGPGTEKWAGPGQKNDLSKGASQKKAA